MVTVGRWWLEGTRMEKGTSPCPRAAPACRDGCRVPACISLPVCSPGLPVPPGNLQQSTGMASQNRRQPHAGLFCFSAAMWPGLTGMQGFASIPRLLGALAWRGAAQAVHSPQWRGWKEVGVLGTLARTHQSDAGALSLAVQTVWCWDGCRCLVHSRGCNGSKVGSIPETAAPSAALPSQG